MFIGVNLDPNDVSPSTTPEEDQNTRFFAYYIMPKYEKSLQDFLDQNNDVIDVSITLKIMSQVFAALEVLHSVGYNHNDIKPSNIMIDNDFNATLIDFGFTTKFMASKNVHLECSETKSFRGNLLYSSQDQMLFKSTSRKDDLTAACYLMFALLNSNIFPMMRRSMSLEYNDSKSMRDKFLYLTSHKKKNSLIDMSQNLKYMNLSEYEESKSSFNYNLGKLASQIQ